MNSQASQDDGCFTYDAAGNITKLENNKTYQWDAEGRLKSVNNGTSAASVYNALGQRVKHTWGSGDLNYLYHPDGSEMGDYWTTYNDWGNAYFNLNGRPIAKYIGTVEPETFFMHTNALGSTTMVTWYNGDVTQKETFYPYGQAWGRAGYVATWRFAGLREGLPITGGELLSQSETRDYPSRLYRWMSPDDFTKDSDVRDPQSWNKYAYARNNPLRYIDAAGEKATVTTQCETNNNNTTCTVQITASIAIYSQGGTTQKQLETAKGAIESQIEDAWKGTFELDGVTYNVTTDVTVTLADSEDAALASGAQNVIAIDSSGRSKSEIFPNVTGRGPDRGVFDYYSGVLPGGIVPHEFSHMLGLDDNFGDVLSQNYTGRINSPHPKAAGQDYKWAFGPELRSGKRKFTVGAGSILWFGWRGNRPWWYGRERQK